MSGFSRPGAAVGLGLAIALAAPAVAAEPAEATGAADAAAPVPAAAPAPQRSAIFHGREYLVPELAEETLAIADGPRPYRHRFAFSPGFGRLGNERLYSFRAAYNPSPWLGWEAAIGHNPGESVHALLHSLSAVVRYPLPWRAQPYGTVGYGMIVVFPGEALNSDPVTENVFSAGGGLEFYVRDDLALRVEARSITVPGGDPVTGDSAAYQYREFTAGLSFYRGLAQ